MRKSHPNISIKFFTLTYILSWVIWLTLILISAQIPEGLSLILRLFGVLMPATSAIILTLRYSGVTGLARLLARFRILDVEIKWWPAIILVYPAILVLSGIIYDFFYTHSVNLLPITAANLIVNAVFLTIASLGEEIGWRGIALPELQKKYPPVTASLILGLLWSAWHIPFWVLIGTLSQYGPFYFALNFLFIVPATFFITWFFNNTRGSLLFPVLFHVSFNIVNVAVFPVTGSVGAFAIFVVTQFVVMLLILPSLKKQGSMPE